MKRLILYLLLANVVNVNMIAFDECCDNKNEKAISLRQEMITNSVHIKGGECHMGSPESEFGRSPDEFEYLVTLPDYSISKYEVTNLQFVKFLNLCNVDKTGRIVCENYQSEVLVYPSLIGVFYYDNQWHAVKGYESHPIVFVTWFGASAFAEFVGAELPTEIQWEFACRANKYTPFNSGGCLSVEVANFDYSIPYADCELKDLTNCISTRHASTLEVGKYLPNDFNLYDMHGNVAEWCQDWYSFNPTEKATNSFVGKDKVIRGGGWYSLAENCRSAKRGKLKPNDYYINLGFRVVFNKL